MATRLGVATLVALLLTPPATLAATAPPAGVIVQYDFVERFPTAVVRSDTTLIKFTSADAPPLLISGFANRVGTAQGAPFLWGTGDHSELRFFVSVPRPLPLSFRCWPFHFKDAPEQRIAVEVNGHDVGEVTLRVQPSRYELTIPAAILHSGENRLVLRYAFSRSRKDISPSVNDSRPLAVAWDWLQFGDRPGSNRPSVVRSDTRSSLILPPGAEVDYYLKVPADSRLVIDDLVPMGSTNPESAKVEVEIQGATAPKATPLTLPRSGRRSVALPTAPDEVVRLAFRVPLESKSGPPVTVEIVHPVLSAPAKSFPDSTAQSSSTRRTTRPNVIIYLIDALRADHLGCYGYAKPTSPAIDTFARESVLFTQTTAQASATRPAVASLFTGLDPRRHGVSGTDRALPPSAMTLPKMFQQAGYETAGFVTNGNVAPAYGFSQGFDVYKYLEEEQTPEVHQLSDRLNVSAFEWLRHRSKSRPFFLYMHATDPHAPYSPRSPYRERFATGDEQALASALSQGLSTLPASYRDGLMGLYDAEIAFNDDSFGALLAELRELGLYDSSVIILMADHGEEFQEHGHWEHAQTLYNEVLHVPLIMRIPGVTPKTVTAHVAQIDLYPTLLGLPNIPLPPGLEGRSLLPLIDGDSGGDDVPIFSSLGERARFESVVDGSFKLIRDGHAVPGLQLYNLDSDPQEAGDLAVSEPIMTAYLYSLVQSSRPTPGQQLPAARGTVDEKTAERLRALGYQP